jgi:hypothetical protein
VVLELAHTDPYTAGRARDYLTLWSTQELAPVTLGWREMRVDSAEDVRLMRTWLIASPEAGDPRAELHELAGYFWHAAERIESIRRAPVRM